MAKPLLSAEAIYDEGLRVLASQGVEGLNARNLCARLRCSTKTLYQQVGNRDALVRGVVARAFARIDLAFSTDESWEDSVRTWCTALRSALFERPALCSLMTVEDADVVVDYANRLIRVLRRHGFSKAQALLAARVLVQVTLSVTLSDVRVSGYRPEVFDTTMEWLIEGMAKAKDYE